MIFTSLVILHPIKTRYLQIYINCVKCKMKLHVLSISPYYRCHTSSLDLSVKLCGYLIADSDFPPSVIFSSQQFVTAADCGESDRAVVTCDHSEIIRDYPRSGDPQHHHHVLLGLHQAVRDHDQGQVLV